MKLLTLLALAFVVQSGFGQMKDALAGTWVLDRGKSEYNPDTTLQSRTLVIEGKDGGMSFVQKTVTDRGNTVQIEFAAKYDGKDVPVTGSQLDTVALKKIDANTVERSGKIKSAVVETMTLKLSNGGKTLTMTTKGSIDGDDYSSTQIFDRQ